MCSNMFLLKNIYIQGSYLLTFVCIVVFGLEASLENAKIFDSKISNILHPSQPWWSGGGAQIGTFSSGKCSRILGKPKCRL